MSLKIRIGKMSKTKNINKHRNLKVKLLSNSKIIQQQIWIFTKTLLFYQTKEIKIRCKIETRWKDQEELKMKSIY
jgi:hypothetical protein